MKKKKKVDYHHRLSQALGGTDEFPCGNLVRVSKSRHAHWHALFSGNRSLESIVDELNKVWIDTRYKLVITHGDTSGHNGSNTHSDCDFAGAME